MIRFPNDAVYSKEIQVQVLLSHRHRQRPSLLLFVFQQFFILQFIINLVKHVNMIDMKSARQTQVHVSVQRIHTGLVQFAHYNCLKMPHVHDGILVEKILILRVHQTVMETLRNVHKHTLIVSNQIMYKVN
jgi:hypothetical protein